MNIRQTIFSILLTGLIAGGCSQEQVVEPPNPFGDESVATINGEPVYAAVFDGYSIARLQKSADDLSDEERDVLMEELIQFELMARAADAAGLTQEWDVAVGLEIQRLQAVSRAMATQHLEENAISESELQIAYEQNIERLSGLQYKARHILVAEETEASEIITELEGGADFQELAIGRSTGPTGPDGGDLGWFSADTMVAPFSAAVSEMEVGTFSEEPVQTRFGWHVILLEDVADQQPPGLEAVRADLTVLVEQRKIEEYLNALRDEAEIVIGESSE